MLPILTQKLPKSFYTPCQPLLYMPVPIIIAGMKSSTTFVCAGIALCFLAAFYSVAPTLHDFLYRSVGVIHNPNAFQLNFFHLNYWFCEILGVVLLFIGLWKLRNEGCS